MGPKYPGVQWVPDTDNSEKAATANELGYRTVQPGITRFLDHRVLLAKALQSA
jgi:hypothetical protein